jgi:phthiocerol/phenolphthiocerol synthesis type-I polyketide synthase E
VIPGDTTDPRVVRRWLMTAIADYRDVAPDDIDTGLSFHDLGLSSSQLISVCGEFEEWLSLPVPAAMLYQYPSIDSLTAALAPGAAVPDPAAPTPPAPGPDREPVCVVGLGCRFPGGADTPELFWRNLMAEVDAAADVPADRWDAQSYFDPDPTASMKSYTTRGGFLANLAGFDADFFGISPAEAVRMDPQQRLLLEVSWAALENAGIAPDRLRGSRTGVFIGMMASQEYGRLQTDHEADACFDDPYFGYGTAPSVAAGRLSYLLDLRGPSMCLDTACSSSLLGVHLAVESLSRGECDLAVAGGVSALLHPASMVQACRAHMLAADGRCKTFDAGADGFLMAEGCGIVVLERTADAIAKGHQVLALVRGSSVSQDGRSNGMTAPNLAAQVQVIRDALTASAVKPRQVGYVETHGSGTKLGDAVEVSALQEVFGADRDSRSPLALGAVKTNVGHLLGAAGVAGFIKAVLALRHSKIPANLHLTERSPDIDWARCPVLLPERATDWPAAGEPRIAGVSSFGWAGTNVHVVLQEGTSSPAEAGGEWQLLTLSARTESALARVAADLHDKLSRDDAPELADVAHTLRGGRAELDYRSPLVCRDLPDALTALHTMDSRSAGRVRSDSHVETGFLFPGTGDHHPGMGQGLRAAEPVFRDVFDECADLLRPELDADLREILYPPDGPTTRGPGTDLAALLGRRVPDLAAQDLLTKVEFAHSAVFAVEYALAKLWQSRGVRPRVMLGYSLGEYVAACLAGVFSLPDALRVVARRARLIGTLPAGAMLAVPMPASELEVQLPAGVSVAAHNGPAMTVAAGPLEAVRQLERLLDKQDIVHRRVNNGYPLHTTGLAPIASDVADLIGGVCREAPEIPVISSRTGSWLTAEQATDPGYWAAQMCEPVRFGQGLRSFAERAGIALEIGPGQTLSSLAGQVLDARERQEFMAIPTLRPVNVEGDDREYLLRAAGRHWAAGGEVDRERAVCEPGRRTVALPAYPFEHRRYWPEGVPHEQVHSGQIVDSKRADLAEWCHVPAWKQSFTVLRDTTAGEDRWLVFTGDGVLDEVVTGLGEAITVIPGAEFHQLEANDHTAYTIDPANPDDYRKLVDHLHDHGRLPTRVLHAWSVASTSAEPVFHGLLHLLTAIGRHAADVRMHVVTEDAQDILPGEQADPWKATAAAFTRTVDQEFPGLRYRTIDLASGNPTAGAALLAELRSDASEHVAYRGAQRWVQAWEPVRIEPAGDTQVWREGGVYLITGGFGGLGMALARDLAARIRPRLALLGRSALPPSTQWDLSQDESTRSRIEAVRTLERLGAEVLPLSADVGDPVQVAAAVAQIRERFGALHGVIHAAGVPAGGLVMLKSREEAERVLRPKIDGALALHEALRDQPPDFLALYSSSVVAFGGLGESDYCAANAFLDAFARRLRGQGLPVTAIDWGPWQRDAWTPTGDGTSAHSTLSRLRELRDRYGITDEEGVDLLTRVLSTGLAQVLVVPQDPELLATKWHALSVAPLEAAPDTGHPRPQLRTPYVAPRNGLERQITQVWRQYLGVDRVGVDDQLFEIGGNSLIGLTIVARLAKELGVPLSGADLFEAPTPAALAAVVASRRGDAAERSAPRGRRGAQRRQLAEAAARRGGSRSKGGSR